MPTANFIVTSLPEYVENNKELILKNFGLSAPGTRSRIGVQTGVKSKEQLNYMEIAPTLQDGSVCELEPAGSVTLTKRDMEVAWIEVLMTICPKKLKGKWAEYLIRANANAESLPFEAYIVDGLVKSLNEKIENLIWMGDKTESTDTDLKWINGFVSIVTAEGTEITAQSTSGTTLAVLQDIYKGVDDVTLKKGLSIFVEPSRYRDFLMDMVNANLYHYAGANEEFPKEFYLPGTDAKVVYTEGLAGSEKAIATFADNLIYGTDQENDNEDVRIVYDPIKEVFVVKALWASGAQVAFPDKTYFLNF